MLNNLVYLASNCVQNYLVDTCTTEIAAILYLLVYVCFKTITVTKKNDKGMALTSYICPKAQLDYT